MSPASERSAERVLVLTPIGRDAGMVEARLVAAGYACEVCRDVPALLAAMGRDAGAVLIAQEALDAGGADALLAALDAQPPWSDLPLLLLTRPLSRRSPHAPPAVGLLSRANVQLLQRPLPLHLLLSAVRSAVRARRRQYEMRDLYRERSRAVELGELFVGILGHDLRTPLGAIRMSAEIIVRSSEDARALRPAGRILRSADRMTAMIEQLLDLARVRQGGGMRPRPAPTDLGDLARLVVQEVGDANPHARLEVSQAGDLRGVWDPDRLAQVVSNLLGNAIQHGTADRPVRVELDGTRAATVRLAVDNEGAIPDEALPGIFEPFERAARPRAGDTGLGLGLFIAREVARAHGGELTVRVAEGRTTFEL